MIRHIKTVVIVLLLIALMVSIYAYHQNKQHVAIVQGAHDSTEAELAQAHTRIADLEGLVEEREEQIEAHKEFIRTLRQQSAGAQTDFSRMRQLIEEATGTINDIKRLEEADERLLAKYSKVYFLNEHYTPEQLVSVPERFTLGTRTVEVHAQVAPFLESLLQALEDAGHATRVVSAYRSFGYQENLKHQHAVTYGNESANQFIATQGYSEHQLGTTVDLSTPALGDNILSFNETEAYEWLQSNAHKYGFVLSYPEGNQYYAFEPWHWRFVGVELATWLHDTGQYFYDATQRDINAYLLDMFEA